jgi:DNA-binding winged helix-turn-helix (wHTH) protein
VNELADFRVGDCTVRPSLGLIVREDETVRVEPRSIDVLVAMAKRPRVVYPKKELIEAVWGDSYVSDEVLTHAVWDLRRAFGDNASDPSYIQTIPKRGYRLIAAVTPVEPDGGSPPDTARDSHRRLLVAALGLAILFAALVALVMPRATPGARASVSPAPALDRVTLAIVASSSPLHDTARSQRLAEELRSELAGKPGILPTRGDSCTPEATGDGGYCLEVRVTELAASYEARIELVLDGTSVWAPRARPVTSANEAGESLAAQLAAYFDVLDMPYYRDPDSRPWIDISKHDTRAVQAFLKGMEQVYANEIGGRELLDDAIEIDPHFIAPRIIRIPTLVAEGDREKLSEYLEHLRALQTRATPFESVMINFADAHSRGALAEEIRWLRAALRSATGNRPVTYILAGRLRASGQLAKACDQLAELVDGVWHYPPLYTDAVSCRILLGQIETARATCSSGLDLEYVDPQLLLMRTLIAVYDDDPATERLYRQRLAQRLDEIAPEVFEFDYTALADKLAQLADQSGRERIADRLREFAY